MASSNAATMLAECPLGQHTPTPPAHVLLRLSFSALSENGSTIQHPMSSCPALGQRIGVSPGLEAPLFPRRCVLRTGIGVIVTRFTLVRPWALLFLLVIFPALPVLQTQAQIAIAPTSVAFGNVLVGSSRTQAVSLTNVGRSTLSVSQASVSGTGYAVSGPTLPYTLSPGQSVNMNVTFTPLATGTDSGSLSASPSILGARRLRKWKASSTITAATTALSGTGVAGQIQPSRRA